MSIRKTIKVLNTMQADGLIGHYAIAGVVASYNYIEPALTEDVDVLASLGDGRDSKIADLEGMIVEGRNVNFLSVSNSLDMEALADTAQVKLHDVNGKPLPTRVMKAEYLVANSLQRGRPQDLICMAALVEQRAVDPSAVADVLTRHGLDAAWREFWSRMRVGGPLCAASAVTGEHERCYPDILQNKAELRRRLAKRSFEEKVEAMEALRERLKPFKEARERRNAERQHKKD